jgi:hypothetical protein
VSIKVKKQECAQTCTGTLAGLGHTSQISKYLMAYPAEWGKFATEAPSLIVKLLGLEASANPSEVGPPFSVLMIDTAGTHWISPGACESKDGNKRQTR